MTGTLVASPFAATDLEAPASLNRNARLACFFIFSDLSCRQVGRFRLKFKMMKVNVEQLSHGSSVPVLREVESQDFEVYSAKDFPGMQKSTSLVEDLRRQGAAISVKKGVAARRKAQSKTSSSISDGSDDEGSTTKSMSSPRTR